MAKRYPWTRILSELQADPGLWRLFPEMVARPTRVITSVNRRQVRALRAPGGRVQARAGWAGITSDGRSIADVYLRWLGERE